MKIERQPKLVYICEKCLKIIRRVGDMCVYEECLQFLNSPLVRSSMRVPHGMSSIELFDVT